MKRIGIDARFLGTETGIGRYILELVKNLPPSLPPSSNYGGQRKLRGAREETVGEEEFVIFLRKENFSLFNSKSGKIKKVLADIPWYGLKEQLRMLKMIAKENLDLMHFPHFNVPVFYNHPFVVTIHDLILLSYPSARATTLGPVKFFLKYFFYRIVIGHAVRKSKSIIVPSQFVKEDILKRFKVNAEKIKVVYEGVSLKNIKIQEYKNKLSESQYFLYVGNAYPHKNLEGLIRAFKLFNQNKNYNLVLIGKEDYFKKRLKKEFADKNIIFKDFVSDEELAGFYRSATAYVFPSFSEGFGLPGIEAMAHGTPVLASNSSCLPEIYGDAAIYFDPKNINQIVEKMEEITANPDLRGALIKKGFERIQKYSWKKMADEILKIYKETF
jgi:glycosyltransferase involved in cell wall biosynthesis